MRTLLLVACLLCAGCHDQAIPDETACTDFRIMTYYDGGLRPIASFFWTHAKTRVVCVVNEKKIERPRRTP